MQRYLSQSFHPFLFAFVIFVWYLLTMPTLVPFSGDAMQEVERASHTELLRSNHLLLTPTFHAGIVIADTFGLHNPILSAQLVNIVFGVAGVLLFYGMTCSVSTSERARWWGTACYALSFVVWRHSVESESAIIANTLLLASGYVLLQAERKKQVPYFALSGVFFGASLLFALNIITLAPLWFFIVLKRVRKNWRDCLVTLVPAWSLFVFVGVFLVRNADHSVSNFLHWILSHGSEGSFSSLKFFSVEMPLRVATGLLNSFQPLSDVTPAVRFAMKGNFSAVLQVPLASWFIFFGALLLAGWLLICCVRWIRGEGKKHLFLFFAGVVPTFIFFALWLASDPQFWLPVIPFLLLIVARAGVSRLFAVASIVVIVIIDIVGMPAPSILLPNAGMEFVRAKNIHSVLSENEILFTMSSPYIVHACDPERIFYSYIAFDLTRPLSASRKDSALADDTIVSIAVAQQRAIVFDELLHPAPRHSGYWATWETLGETSREKLLTRLTHLPGYKADTLLLDNTPTLRLTTLR